MPSLLYSQYAGDGAALQTSLDAVMRESETTVPGLRTLITEKIIPYFSQLLVTVLMMNTSYNNTTYINDDMQAKVADAKRKEHLVRNNLHKARYSYMQKKYTIGYNKFVTAVMQGLILVVALSAALIAVAIQFHMGALFIGLSIASIVLFFLIIVAVFARNNMTRRPDDWNKFYFAPYQMSNNAA